ncbi:MAG: pyridoxal-phosphate dependent enzyme [Pyrinomonadaceae bacterium]|nr:pyridoxal-phosphate dependent enzyme [Pyrinomonadaceae bacterium]
MQTLLEAIRPTTFIRSEKLSGYLGIDLTIATETFQHTGSFKFRAAYNVALNVENEHLIAASSGNFGQALAYSAKLLGKKCHVVMPETSAKVKVDAVSNYGAVADLIDVNSIGREERVAQLMEEFPDAYQASAYDDPLVIDGNSTLGDEIADYKEDFDFVVVPVGGAGLISGISKALCGKDDRAKLIGAEPLIANDAARSLRLGKIVRNEQEPQTIADGARTVSVGNYNWEIIREGVQAIVEVSEANIKQALCLYFQLANLKVEPTGALSLAAMLENHDSFGGKKVCVVVSGGNVDPAIFVQILAG